MKRRFPLAAVLRVRQALEESARAEVVRANLRVRQSEEQAIQREASLKDQKLPTETPITPFLGAVLATRSMATEVSALRELTRQRRQELAVAQGLWTAAEQAHSAVEKLAERHLLLVEHERARAEQRELDEVAQRGWRIADWENQIAGEFHFGGEQR
jgi:flagellar FliJ protein